MHQVPVAFHTTFFITLHRIEHCSVGKHCTSLFRDIYYVLMTLETLLVFKGGIGFFSVFIMVILPACKVDNNILDTMSRFCIEKVIGILRCWKVTIHAVRNKALCVVCMSRGLPCIICELDLMA